MPLARTLAMMLGLAFGAAQAHAGALEDLLADPVALERQVREHPETLPIDALVMGMATHADPRVRAHATRLLQQVEARRPREVLAAVLGHFAYDPDATALPWRHDGPLHAAHIPRNTADRDALAAHLVAWMVHCEERGWTEARSHLAGKLATWLGGGHEVPASVDAVLHVWALSTSSEALRALLVGQGLAEAPRYAAVLARQRDLERAEEAGDTDALASLLRYSALAWRARAALEQAPRHRAARSVVQVWEQEGPTVLPELRWPRSQAHELLWLAGQEAHHGDLWAAEWAVASPSLCSALQRRDARPLVQAHLDAEQADRVRAQMFLDQALFCVLDTPRHATVNGWLFAYAHYEGIPALRRVLAQTGLRRVPHYQGLLERARFMAHHRRVLHRDDV